MSSFSSSIPSFLFLLFSFFSSFPLHHAFSPSPLCSPLSLSLVSQNSQNKQQHCKLFDLHSTTSNHPYRYPPLYQQQIYSQQPDEDRQQKDTVLLSRHHHFQPRNQLVLQAVQYPGGQVRQGGALGVTTLKATSAAEEKGGNDGLQARLKVGSFFALWYILNIGYNIYNKRVLNAIPLPWTIGALQLWVGLLYFCPLWLTGLRKAPKLTGNNIKNLLPVAFMHTAAHITAVISLGAGAVSFTHIVKAGEPFFTSVLSALLLKQYMPAPVYATLLPVVAGVGLASLKELSFSWLSFGTAMGSNTASALRGIFSKKLMGKPQGKNMNATNLYAVLTVMGALMLSPFAYAIEGGQWSAAIQNAISNPELSKKTLTIWALLSGLYYYTYNEVAFLTLDNVNPVTHAVGNTIKRVVIIIASVVVFKTSMSPLSIFGSSLAIGGVLLYSLAKDYYAKKK